MAPMKQEVKASVAKYRGEGRSVAEIQRLLVKHHGCRVSRQGLYKFLSHGSITRRKDQTDRRKIKPFHRECIQMWMCENNELCASEIRDKLKDLFGLTVSLALVKKTRRDLGWTSNTGKYCQQISNANKRARLEWACKMFREKEAFRDVIFADESSVEMNAHGKLFFHQAEAGMEMKTRKHPRPKHAYKVHVWAGISYAGKTPICVFTGIMNSGLYQNILASNLLPFVEENFPNGFRFYQDNDSKHTSRSTKEWMREKGILDSVMKTPASSPDLNPIENVWASMKHHLQTKVKPRTKQELVNGIVSFWDGLTPEQCGRYIDHIHRVIPQVIVNGGAATNF